MQAFAVLDSFESSLLERPVIAEDLARSIPALLSAFRDDIAEVSAVFKAGRARPAIAKHASPIAGALAWANSLRQRVLGPMERLRALGSIATNDLIIGINGPFETLLRALAEYEMRVMGDWCAQVSGLSDAKLKQPLLRWDMQIDVASDSAAKSEHKRVLKVNFDPALIALLREVQGMRTASALPMQIPAAALMIAERGEFFRVQVANLDLLCNEYNAIQHNALAWELPLFAVKLAAAETTLDKGAEGLTWSSHRIDEYITEATLLVEAASKTLGILQSNEASIRSVLKSWRTDVMFERKYRKVYRLQDLESQMKDLLTVRHAAICNGASEIISLISSSRSALEPAPAAAAWQDYITYVSEFVSAGLVDAVLTSTAALQAEVGEVRPQESPPLLEVDMRLTNSVVNFVPALVDGVQQDAIDPMLRSVADFVSRDDRIGSTVESVMNWLLQGFAMIGHLVPQFNGSPGSFAGVISNNTRVAAAYATVHSHVSACCTEAAEVAGRFQSYEVLWALDAATVLQEFLAVIVSDDGGPPPHLSLEAFEAEIARYCAIQEEIATLPATCTVGFLKLDCRPARASLVTCVAEIIAAFTKFLESKVVDSMAELFKFMKHADTVLDHPVGPELGNDTPRFMIEPNETAQAESAARKQLRAEGTREGLYLIMSAMRDVRARESVTDAMFGPLHACVALLQKYGITVTDDVVAQMEAGPQAWKSLQKKMNARKLVLAPLQVCERADIKAAATQFGNTLEDFRRFFKATAPFSIAEPVVTLQHVCAAYKTMDALHHGNLCGKPSITQLQADAMRIREQQEMFELSVQDYNVLSSCLDELTALKALWDVSSSMLHSFVDWQATPWQDVDTDNLIEMTRHFAKDIKLLPKAVKTFQIYRLIEDGAKAMATALPLVQELRHPAMRPHHWQQLMKATGKVFSMGQGFSLGDLLRLQLHVYADACAEIVDRAQKEQVIEKALAKISATWESMQLTFTPHKDGSDVLATSIDDAVAEALENDNVALQNLAASKYVQGNSGFQEQVSSWLRKIGTVDLVLASWSDVQRRWANLESIFVGSADIRLQLPADSARFDGLNKDFQDLMREAPRIKNVVDACMVPRRAERLDALLEQLEQCQKALQDYLETKRLAFPRFYFVAPADLLDILSKGSTPQAIMRRFLFLNSGEATTLGSSCICSHRNSDQGHVSDIRG